MTDDDVLGAGGSAASGGTERPTGFATVSVAAILSEAARKNPERTAVIFGDQEISYAELWWETRHYAGALRARGVGHGTPVAVLIPNVPDFPRV